MKDFELVNKIVHRISNYINGEDFMWLLIKAMKNEGESIMEDKDLIQKLLKRVEYLESLEHIKHPDHIRDIITDLTERMNELEYKIDTLKEL